MYALKTETDRKTRVISIGDRFTIQYYGPEEKGVACVIGEDERFCFEISNDMNAYITTIEGKTVQVIHRSLGSNKK